MGEGESPCSSSVVAVFGGRPWLWDSSFWVKRGKFIKCEKEEALLIEKLIQAKPWLEWEKAAEEVRKAAKEAAAQKATQAAKAEVQAGEAATEHAASAAPKAGDRINEYESVQNESAASSGAVGSLGDLKQQTDGKAIDQLSGGGIDADTP